MFYVNEFVEEILMTILNDLEMKGTECMLWLRTLVTRVRKLLKIGPPMPVNCKAHWIPLHPILCRLDSVYFIMQLQRITIKQP